MTQDKARKHNTRDRAGGTRDRRTQMSYTAAHRTDPKRPSATETTGPVEIPTESHQDRGDRLPRPFIEEHLDEAEKAFNSDDPYQRQAAYSTAAQMYAALALHTSDPTWKQAAQMASQRYDTIAARIRFEHNIPTLRPMTEATLLHLGHCDGCGRPWQAAPDGACDDCPRLLFGPTPHSREQAEQLPAGTPANLDGLRDSDVDY